MPPKAPGGAAAGPSVTDYDYLLNPTAQADDLPATVLAGDDAPDRHWDGEWNGVRADGAAARFAASEWGPKLKNPGQGQAPPTMGKGMKKVAGDDEG